MQFKIYPGTVRDGAWHAAAADKHARGLVHDMTACGTVHSGFRVNVTRASGYGACSVQEGIGHALECMAECNRQVPSDPAHVIMWDDDEWLPLLATVTLANAGNTLCGNCGCTFSPDRPARRVVTDFRTDVLCAPCTASYTWEPAAWQMLNPEHWIRVPR
jgi:hypothetical protein